jgi:hypothetical protein
MILVQRKISNSNVSVIEMKEFDKEALNEAKERFDFFKLQGIIKDCNFEDASWTITNESFTTKISFEFNEIVFVKESRLRELGTYDGFINAVKSYHLYKLETNVLSGIYEMNCNFKNVFNETQFLNSEYIYVLRDKPLKSNSYFGGINMLLEFLDYYNLEVDEEYLSFLIIRMIRTGHGLSNNVVQVKER